ncbi:MAG: metal-dependent transcriptional regulator [Atopobium sp.]|uniref:metal-dependent transcriptional regulator n=1 Tax=Atopobium sp. TaxID=1872650 RepID=UPI002A801A05|nr:metal-dependent transcriptional regulator [Atopobium sp.]MDY4522829.1 metal-dependent transcriptional regulator [Atopobium sp.]
MSEQDFIDEHRLSMANEDYLESIYRITVAENNPSGIRSVDVADQLNVSKASVNKAISTLKDAGYVEQNRYGRVTLTQAGREYGSEVWHAHRLIRAFLEKDLGVDPEIANEEACTMEHALSRDTMRRWAKFLADQGFSIDQGEEDGQHKSQ